MQNAIDKAFISSGGGGGGTSYTAGEATDISSGDKTISVKYDGSTIILNENDELQANITEPEPTKLYTAGDAIDITDRIISVKHDDTLAIDETGKLNWW